MTDWSVAETALQAWIAGASGLASGRVYLENQDGNAPDDQPFATFHIGDDQNIGMPERVRTVDPANPATTLLVTSTDVITTVVEISFFTPGKTLGNASARQLASNIRASLGLDDFRGPLNVAGVGVLRAGPVRWIPDLNNRTQWEGRAVLEVEITVALAALGRVGYIAQVIGTTTLNEGNTQLVTPFSVP